MKHTRVLTCALFAALASLAPSLAFADGIVVIVNKANDGVVDKAFVSKIYRGEARTWPDGGGVTAYDLPEDNLLREDFDGTFVGKSEKALLALWSQNALTGKALPPKVATSDEDVKKAVAANKHAIGYIQARNLDDTVKAALR